MCFRSKFTKELAKGATKETAYLIPKVYDDLIHPTANVVGERLKTAVDFVLTPIELIGIGKQKLFEWLNLYVAEELKSVPTEDIIHPDPVIAIPIIQQINYSYNHEHLRDMYAKLLAKAMNRKTSNEVKPAFVEILKQLSPLDALVLKEFIKFGHEEAYMSVGLKRSETSDEYTIKFDILHTILYPEHDNQEVSLSISNLCRLGVLVLNSGKSMSIQRGYESIRKLPQYNLVLNKFCNSNKKLVYEERGMIEITMYGFVFRQSVI